MSRDLQPVLHRYQLVPAGPYGHSSLSEIDTCPSCLTRPAPFYAIQLTISDEPGKLFILEIINMIRFKILAAGDHTPPASQLDLYHARKLTNEDVWSKGLAAIVEPTGNTTLTLRVRKPGMFICLTSPSHQCVDPFIAESAEM